MSGGPEAVGSGAVRRVYRVRIPAKPVAKGRARANPKTGVHYTPKQTTVAEAWVRLKAVEAVGTPRVAGPVAVRIVFVMPIPKTWSIPKRRAAEAGRSLPVTKPDWDNLAKLVSDALNGIAWADDAAVARAEVLKRYGPDPETVVEWWQMTADEMAELTRAMEVGADLAPPPRLEVAAAAGLL